MIVLYVPITLTWDAIDVNVSFGGKTRWKNQDSAYLSFHVKVFDSFFSYLISNLVLFLPLSRGNIVSTKFHIRSPQNSSSPRSKAQVYHLIQFTRVVMNQYHSCPVSLLSLVVRYFISKSEDSILLHYEHHRPPQKIIIRKKIGFLFIKALFWFWVLHKLPWQFLGKVNCSLS